MSSRHPHLIVLGGPDGGRSIRLDHLPIVIGRSGDCQIHLAEEFISREHLRLVAGDEGVVLDVLSAAGVRIAGRKYRKGQHILLATGDIFTLGAETDILYVAGGDDTKAALAEVQAARAAAAAARQAEAAQPSTEAEPADLVELEPVEPEPAAMADAEPPTPAELAERQRAQRMRKMVIAFGIYFAVLIVIVLLIVLFRGAGSDGAATGLKQLKRGEMLQILDRPAEGLSPNSQEAQNAAADARQCFAGRHLDPGGKYRCIRQYIRYKAYADRPRLEDAADKGKYDTALDELMDELWPTYERACLEFKQGRWHAAKKEFERVRELVPLENDPINKNVQRFLSAVNTRIRESKRKPRSGPLG